ncbi:MAG: hypothetical protein NC429_08685 [Lachnospiraceae bacterium]|nr:hypothetical protein [Lachnospiraceae bacterium]
MEYLVFAAALVFILALLMLKGYADHKRDEKHFIQRLYEEYGTLPEKEYKAGQFENISHYFEKHSDGFCVDDITWNDLNMDELFKNMNYTWSAAGEEYLYYLLRKPSMDLEELEERERIIEYFRTNADQRVCFQFAFSKLGRCGKFSIYDYLDYLDNLGNRSNIPHYLSLALFLLSIGVLLVNVPIGLVVMVCILIYNNVTYFKTQKEIDPYITSFAYVFRLLDAVDELKNQPVPVISEELSRLRAYRNAMRLFKSGSYIVMSGARMTGTGGNPLDMLMDFLRMGFHLDLIKFNQMLSEVRKHIAEIDGMLTILGKIEAMIAIGEYREAHPYCVPEFTDKREIEVQDMYHPLLRDPVANSVAAAGSVLITGSNASGKSTFLKTMAISAILAQTIHTCPAKSCKTGMFRVCSSMTLRDDVQGGSSYYMVEIKALKRILDLLNDGNEVPVLCFVDEVLRGTNTVERIAASTEILRSMAGQNCICFAATHDIELTHLLEGTYQNYHFAEQIEDNDIFFSYKLLDGRASTRNAIKLLGIMGYDGKIIREAEEMAQVFLQTGHWHGIDLQKV